MRPGIQLFSVTSSVVLYAAWLKHSMDIPMLEPWGATLPHSRAEGRAQTTWSRMAVVVLPSHDAFALGDLRRRSQDGRSKGPASERLEHAATGTTSRGRNAIGVVSLGCRVKTQVQTVTYDMETYLDMTVKKYCDVTGFDSSKFEAVPSPSPAEETKHHPARAPASTAKSHRCTWCGNAMPVDADGRLVPPPPIPKAPVEEEVSAANRGALAPQAAGILMKLLYAARICRFNLLCSINNLARKSTE